jgi:CrcB protein
VIALLVILGAAVGAPLRYLTDRTVQSHHDSVFPWGTLVVNLAGSFLLALLATGATLHAVPGSLTALFGIGLCGALTTYSTFSYETIRLTQTRARFYAIANLAASIGGSLGAAFCGAAVALAVWS